MVSCFSKSLLVSCGLLEGVLVEPPGFKGEPVHGLHHLLVELCLPALKVLREGRLNRRQAFEVAALRLVEVPAQLRVALFESLGELSLAGVEHLVGASHARVEVGLRGCRAGLKFAHLGEQALFQSLVLVLQSSLDPLHHHSTRDVVRFAEVLLDGSAGQEPVLAQVVNHLLHRD